MRALLLFTFLLPFAASAQSDTSMVEQYCQVSFHSPLFSGKIIINLDKGDKQDEDQQDQVMDENGKPMRFNTVIAALNYMGRQGWTMVNAYQQNASGNAPVYYYIFKKLFKKTALKN